MKIPKINNFEKTNFFYKSKKKKEKENEKEKN